MRDNFSAELESGDRLWEEVLGQIEGCIADARVYAEEDDEEGIITVARETTHDLIRTFLLWERS